MLALLACATAQAQEAVRNSIASERAAEARKANRTDAYYNLDLDPVKLRFSASLAGEYNDNINQGSTNALEDYIVRPQIGVRAFWPVSERNTLDLNFNFGYEHYVNGTRPSRFIVTGDQESGVFFDVYVGDFLIDLHDKFSLMQDPGAEASANGVASIFRLENTLGTAVTWDLDKLVLDFTYDHFNYVPLDDAQKYLGHQSELGTIRVAASLNPALTAGLELGGGTTEYSEPPLSNNRHISIGPFARYQVSQSIDARASVGYTLYWFDAASFSTNTIFGTNSFPQTNSFTQAGFYADVAITHQPTERTTQTLNIGQSLSTDINSAPVELFYVRYSVSLAIIQYWTFRPYVTFETGTEHVGTRQEELDRFGAGLSVGRKITDKLTGAVSYQWLKKESNIPELGYNQNRLVLDLNYQF